MFPQQKRQKPKRVFHIFSHRKLLKVIIIPSEFQLITRAFIKSKLWPSTSMLMQFNSANIFEHLLCAKYYLPVLSVLLGMVHGANLRKPRVQSLESCS